MMSDVEFGSDSFASPKSLRVAISSCVCAKADNVKRLAKSVDNIVLFFIFLFVEIYRIAICESVAIIAESVRRTRLPSDTRVKLFSRSNCLSELSKPRSLPRIVAMCLSFELIKAEEIDDVAS